MSVSHEYSTIGGIEYDGGGYVEKTKKEKVLLGNVVISKKKSYAHARSW